MKYLLKSLMCVAALAIAGAAEAHTDICAKSPEAKWGCFWTKGVVNDSADAGDVITLEGHGGYILDVEPKALRTLIGAGGKYIPGDYEFCPFSPRLHIPAGVYNLEWRYYGCIESFKNVTVIDLAEIDMRKPGAEKELERRICSLVDCSRPGFSDFRTQKSVP
ncbi:MAG: hypothetical protein EPO08_17390 [Rhodospirillaceae bacterium]|nr:MAG: hypothetical protein EPO08_17390 [Rhodospirillaceae bacterium]